MKKRHRIVWCDRGFFPLYYGFCPSKKAWNREMRRHRIKDCPYPDTDGRCTTFEHREKGKPTKVVVLVTIAEHCDTLSHVGVIGLIAHEAMHVWQAVRDTMQEKDPSIEFEAYSVEFITGNLYTAWTKTRAPRKLRAGC